MEKNWKPNKKQQDFMRVLGENADGLTLNQASKLVGYELKSGSTNALISKKLVETEDCQLKCLIVLEDNPNEVVGHMTKTVKRYRLVRKD